MKWPLVGGFGKGIENFYIHFFKSEKKDKRAYFSFFYLYFIEDKCTTERRFDKYEHKISTEAQIR